MEIVLFILLLLAILVPGIAVLILSHLVVKRDLRRRFELEQRMHRLFPPGSLHELKDYGEVQIVDMRPELEQVLVKIVDGAGINATMTLSWELFLDQVKTQDSP